jgi:hypothetical protein
VSARRPAPPTRQWAVRVHPSRVAFAALVLGATAHAQSTDHESMQALGGFDQIATQCARGGSESEIDVYRLKLWHAYLVGQGAADTSPQRIRELIAHLRAQINGDATDELRRQYRDARAAIPDVGSLSPEQQREFYQLCEAPHVRGAPGAP